MLAIVNFIIAVVFLYTIFSLFTSWCIEFYSRLANERGKFMWNKLKKLFDGEYDKDKRGIVEAILNNPVVKSMSKKGKPEFVPAELFAKVLATEAAEDNNFADLDFDDLKNIAEKFSVSKDLEALWQGLIEELKVEGGKTIKDLEQKIVQWFNFYEERLKQWYKDHIRIFLFAAGLILAGIANIDSIHIAKELWNDKALSSRLAYQGEQAAGTSIDSLTQAFHKETLQELSEQGIPIGRGENHKTNVLNILGILISGIAISFGGPFWFEILQRLVGFKKSYQQISSQVKPEDTT